MRAIRKTALWAPLWAAFLLVPLVEVTAKDTYDLGKVQVVGQDAQSTSMTPDSDTISQEMGERSELTPEIPLTEEKEVEKPVQKPTAPETVKTRTGGFTMGMAKGTRNSFEVYGKGHGYQNGYIGSLSVGRSSRDGFRSTRSEDRTWADLSLHGNEGSYDLDVAGTLATDKFAQRGWRTNPSPDAAIEDAPRRLIVKGSSTLPDGAYFQAEAAVDSITRTTSNRPFGVNEEATLSSGRVGAEYASKLSEAVLGKVGFDIRRDSFGLQNGPEQDLTKRNLRLSAQHRFERGSSIELGLKSLGLMNRERTAPMFRLDYRMKEPWQLILSYDEDLGNDSLEKVFLPRQYVGFATLRASHQKRTSAKVNYRSPEQFHLGLELFQESEDQGVEYVDAHDVARNLLTSQIRFADDAKRRGMKVSGSVKLDEHFVLKAGATFQNPEDTATGRQLSYEAKRLFDVELAYEHRSLKFNINRKSESDRVAYTPVTKVGLEDYSRTDLECKYQFDKHFSAFVRVNDLYDEAQEKRYNVPEEGRVSLLGVEAQF
ncbi:MAG TPA: TonB-dependent receptor [Candidatus Ozemobacteraceae bacterium]|nr:TonB-dependent receptor [Candidatus Ozemobacteraceae bacterium]